jgi:cytochrome c oxidase assembly protein subunit 15
MIAPSTNHALHRVALLTAAVTFPLIFMGGLVTSHQAGMSVPDWPNTYGYNMFLFPPRLWIGGILYEHTHRLMGSVVGFVSIILAITAWRTERRAWVRRLAYAVLGAVIYQGVLGGLRVVLVKLDLAVIHACFAQAFFCLTALVCVVTSDWWIARHAAPDEDSFDRGGKRLVILAGGCVLAIYSQLVIGALMRHDGAGLAIPDLPLAYGRLLPPTTAAGVEAVNHVRAWQYRLPSVTLTQLWLHFGHRIGAVVVTTLVLALSALVVFRFRNRRALVLPAVILVLLLAAQIALGVLTVLLRKPADIASAHVAVGALVLFTAFVLTTRAARLYWPTRVAQRRAVSAAGLTRSPIGEPLIA